MRTLESRGVRFKPESTFDRVASGRGAMRTKAWLAVAVVLGLLAVSVYGIAPPAAASRASVAVSASSVSLEPLIQDSAQLPQPQASASSWTLLGTHSPPRDGHGFVYDAKAGVFIVFGGAISTSTFTNSTWTYDYAAKAWTNVTPVVGPSPRVGGGFVYNSKADRAILFGGSTSAGAYSNETWSFDLTNDTWTRMSPAVFPSGRVVPAMAYDAHAGLTVLYGGDGISGALGDTWTYNYTTDEWSPVSVPSPGALFFAEMTYVASAQRDVLFGGISISGASLVFHFETRAFDATNNTWTLLAPPSHPSGRAASAFSYDSVSDRAILFAGTTSLTSASGVLNDTWAYNYAQDEWTNVTPISSPSPRLFPAMAFDSVANRTVLFGGAPITGTPYNDTWAFAYAPQLPGAPRNLVASGGAGRITLTWQAPTSDGGSPITNYTIYRGTASGAETLLTIVGKVLTYADLAVTPGTTYYYEVAAVTAVGEGPKSNEASATPSGAAAPPSAPQNPAAAGGNAQVTLTWQTPASDGGSPITGYNVYRGTAAGGEALLTRLGVTLTYTDNAVTNGVTYFYKVSANNSAGEGPLSTEVSATPATVPTAPQNFVATAGNAQVVLTWQAPASSGGAAITNYKIYRGTSSGSETLLTTVGSVLTYTDAAVTNGATYYYEVSAVNGAGEGAKSSEAHATPTAPVVDTTPPLITVLAPANNSVSTTAKVFVHGTALDDVAVAKVELSTDGTSWSLASGTTVWSGNVTLVQGTNTIYVRATDTSNNARVVTLTVTLQVPVPGPQGLDPVLLAGIGVIVLIAVLALVLLVWRRRKKETPPPPPPPPPGT